ARLQGAMSERVGPFRTAEGLQSAQSEIEAMTAELGDTPPAAVGRFDAGRLDWFDLRNMLLVAEAVASAAMARDESRGAHQREDHPVTYPSWDHHQTFRLNRGFLELSAVASP